MKSTIYFSPQHTGQIAWHAWHAKHAKFWWPCESESHLGGICDNLGELAIILQNLRSGDSQVIANDSQNSLCPL